MNTLIVIPARIASTRLPKKMLADIAGMPLILHTVKSVLSSGYKDVIVACDGDEIANAVKASGIEAIVTDPSLTSGTDRIYAAYRKYDKDEKYDFIVNVQGDMPFVSPDFIKHTVEILKTHKYDMSTVATLIKDNSYLNENVVKPVVSTIDTISNNNTVFCKSIYFSRSPIPYGGPYYHHVGIYGFTKQTLKKFVSLPQSPLEKKEHLEQLRALENGMTIGIALLEADSPISVDTAEDLEKARKYFFNH